MRKGPGKKITADWRGLAGKARNFFRGFGQQETAKKVAKNKDIFGRISGALREVDGTIDFS